jgi:hypothetical protein
MRWLAGSLTLAGSAAALAVAAVYDNEQPIEKQAAAAGLVGTRVCRSVWAGSRITMGMRTFHAKHRLCGETMKHTWQLIWRSHASLVCTCTAAQGAHVVNPLRVSEYSHLQTTPCCRASPSEMMTARGTRSLRVATTGERGGCLTSALPTAAPSSNSRST